MDNTNTKEVSEDNDTNGDSLDISDLSNISDGENKGLALLKRLQQLKVWQARQEALLLDEQRQQISLRLSEVEEQRQEQEHVHEDTDDDTTISSLISDHEMSLPRYIQQQPVTPLSPDRMEDIPVSGGGKTFEQLMEEKLTGKEGEVSSAGKKVLTPKPFLKRGSGLSRFNLPADPAKQPGRLRNKSAVEQDSKDTIQIQSDAIRKSNVAPRYLNTEKSVNKYSPVRKNNSKQLHSYSPPSKLKLKPSQSSSEISKPRSDSPPKPAKFNLCDSVENSFCDKLSLQAQRNMKDLKELEVFQLLENAANDSSFCSNSSQIKTLVSNAILPTPNKMVPNLKMMNNSSMLPTPISLSTAAKTSFASSTPATHQSQVSAVPTVSCGNSDSSSQKDIVDPYDPSMGESLMEDIRKFLQAKVANPNPASESTVQAKNLVNNHDNTDIEDDSEWTDESDDSTLNGEENLTIGRDWKKKIATATSEKENNRPGQVLEFSPPDKLPADPPSHLIWEIFGKERERRQRMLEKKQVPIARKVNSPPSKKTLGVRFENTGKTQQGMVGPGVSQVNKEASQDLSFQSTLLHMRVVELEQEIDNFKKENKKIVNIKKKLQLDKDKLAKDLADFDNLRETEKKKIEEEKRRIKRDKMLLEKGKKQQLKGCEECIEKSKQVDILTKELKTKEVKWTEEVNKLKDQLKKSHMDHQELKNENQKLRLNKVSSKLYFDREAVREVGPEVVVRKHIGEEDLGSQGHASSESTSEQGDSGEDRLDSATRKTITDTIYNTLCQDDVPVMEGEGAREKRFNDGRVEVWYSNGNRKEVSGDGKVVKLFYYNGDVKESHSDGMVRYLYSHTQTWHTTNTDGTEILQFSNGQEETRLPDGSSSISFPDGSVKTISVGGVEKITFPDTTVVTVQPNGDRLLELPNGQVEEHTSQHKKRTYPDGTVKIVHTDGRQETRYAGGRVRVKNSQGVLIQDTGTEQSG